MNLSDTLIERLGALSRCPLPDSLAEAAKQSVLEFVGVSLGGSRVLGEEETRFLGRFGPSEEASVIGFGRRASLYNAAMVNAFCSHILELDDGNRFCMVHLNATVMPAVLAAAEHENADGERLLRAVAVGYEAAVRVGRAIQPGHRQLGFHATGTCGTIGAAMGVAAVLGLDRAAMKAALSCACTGAAGLLEIQEDDSRLKPYNAAKAALNGLAAAYTAGAGFAGPDDILTGKRGFLRLFSPAFDPSPIAAPLAHPYGLETVYRKPYAACRHAHAPIEAALRLRARRAASSGSVCAVDVFTHKFAIAGHDHTEIRGLTSAKMSIPYGVAVAYLTGTAGMESFFPEQVCDPAVLGLARRVKVLEDEALTALIPDKRAAVVRITFSDGTCMTERIDSPKGEPETPMSAAEMEEKFRSLALYAGKSRETADRVVQCVRHLERDAKEFYTLLGHI